MVLLKILLTYGSGGGVYISIDIILFINYRYIFISLPVTC